MARFKDSRRQGRSRPGFTTASTSMLTEIPITSTAPASGTAPVPDAPETSASASDGSAETTSGKSPMGLALVVFGLPLAAILLMAIVKRLFA